ncbi:MAG: crossover junction endodeoxyribonuclease RuvC [Chloroflexi bacterium]|nr:crossover junction endodeoxyribonuclease RuvC [Chloroflexota bacterium]
MTAGVILGIDPGTTGMGYAVLDPSSDPARVIDCALIPVAQRASAAERLAAIADAIEALIRTHRPTTLALERLYFNKNVQTAMVVAEARGVALLCGARAGLAVAEYTPSEVKVSVTGSGAAEKAQVQRMVALLVRADRPITQDNVADAIAIALTHAQRVQFTDAVARARWPARAARRPHRADGRGMS